MSAHSLYTVDVHCAQTQCRCARVQKAERHHARWWTRQGSRCFIRNYSNENCRTHALHTVQWKPTGVAFHGQLQSLTRDAYNTPESTQTLVLISVKKKTPPTLLFSFRVELIVVHTAVGSGVTFQPVLNYVLGQTRKCNVYIWPFSCQPFWHTVNNWDVQPKLVHFFFKLQPWAKS